MDLPLTPIVTVMLNIIASFLVSKGILDNSTKDTFIQLANNIISGIMTIIIAVYSINKIVDLNKHKMTIQGPQTPTPPTPATTEPASPLSVVGTTTSTPTTVSTGTNVSV